MNIKDEIKALKEQKNAVILAHYYVADEIQEIADYVGDSFALSKTAATCQPHHRLLRCLLHGGKRLSVKPRKEGADAGCKRGLPHGAHGNKGRGGRGKRSLRGFGRLSATSILQRKSNPGLT